MSPLQREVEMESLISVAVFLIIVSSSFPTELGALLDTDILLEFCQKQVLAATQDGLIKTTKSLLGNCKKTQTTDKTLGRLIGSLQ